MSDELLEKARQNAMKISHGEGIPVRVYCNEGLVIWSMVDDEGQDLTLENSEGLLFPVSSVFVPHGEVNPLEAIVKEQDDGE